jgi:hypothetical protein
MRKRLQARRVFSTHDPKGIENGRPNKKGEFPNNRLKAKTTVQKKKKKKKP